MGQSKPLQQLSRSRVGDGEYDELIAEFMDDGLTNDQILGHVMMRTKGCENPNIVSERIKKLADVRMLALGSLSD